MSQFNELVNIIDQNNPVKLTNSFSTAWEDLKRHFGPYIGYALLSLVISFVVGSVVPFGGMVLSPFIALGYATFVYSERSAQNSEFNNFFLSFKKFGPVFLASLITIAGTLIATLPIIITGGAALIGVITSGGRDREALTALMAGGLIVSGIISVILLIIASILFSFATYFAYFYNVEPMEAVKLSVKLATKNFGHMLMLVLFAGFVSGIGAIACGIGLIVTIPLGALITYHSFEGIMNLEKGNEPDFDFEKK